MNYSSLRLLWEKGERQRRGWGEARARRGQRGGDDGLSSTRTGARRDPERVWEGDREGGEKQRVISPAKPNGLIHRHGGGRKGVKEVGRAGGETK